MTVPGQRLRVAIAGGSGYGGAETLRWLADHPHFEVAAVTSRSFAGKTVADVHPHLAGFHAGLRFGAEPTDALAASPDAFVLALPHKEAASWAWKLLQASPDLRIVDLSGDHRLGDASSYRAAYGADHPHPEVLGGTAWIYGLPEAFKDRIRRFGRRVANPGCFATGAILGALPLATAGLVAGPVRHVAITGSSGSGVEPAAGTHHPERVENVRAYKVLDHQHVPEIQRCLGAGLDADCEWRMVPQSGPFARGIFTTLFVPLRRPLTTEELRQRFAEEYADDPFVRMRADTPQVGHVRNTNFCDIAVKSAGDEAVVLTAIDNLGKGMVTQAIQNLNLMFGLDETAGLLRAGGRP